MISIAVIFLFSVVIRCAVAAEAAFDCIIASDSTTYAVGEVPNVTFRITNKSKKEVVLVGSLDGSTDDRRFPKCRFEILDSAGKPVALPVALCGNMNTLRVPDFVVVPVGGTFDPLGEGFFRLHQFSQFPISAPGNYTLQFSYSTSDRIMDYFGDERMSGQTTAAPEIQRLFERVPNLHIESNKLKLTFTAQAK
ncbi:MAG TPA: hypothetical protein VF585_12075 [Chthoniobacterales bacterium]|jgi:hypothetical protein